MNGWQKMATTICVALAALGALAFGLVIGAESAERDRAYDQACIDAGGTPVRGNSLSACVRGDGGA